MNIRSKQTGQAKANTGYAEKSKNRNARNRDEGWNATALKAKFTIRQTTRQTGELCILRLNGEWGPGEKVMEKGKGYGDIRWLVRGMVELEMQDNCRGGILTVETEAKTRALNNTGYCMDRKLIPWIPPMCLKYKLVSGFYVHCSSGQAISSRFKQLKDNKDRYIGLKGFWHFYRLLEVDFIVIVTGR